MTKNEEKDHGAALAEVVTARSASAGDAAPHDANEIVTVELDPKVWVRGRGFAYSKLLTTIDGHRAQCCIGVACTALGVPDESIRGRGYASSSMPYPLSEIHAAWSADEANYLRVYAINDDVGRIPDTERVALINANLAEMGVPLRFTLKAEEGY